jgi:hypothetical protein
MHIRPVQRACSVSALDACVSSRRPSFPRSSESMGVALYSLGRDPRSGTQVDEDGYRPRPAGGFTIVAKRRTPKIVRAQKTAATGAAERQLEKRKKRKQAVLDFYRFQRRERKQKELVSLRARFEEDKRRLAIAKEQRKFKPY